MLDEIAATGYTGTELGDWGFMPTDPAALHDETLAPEPAADCSVRPDRARETLSACSGHRTAVKTARLLSRR